MPKIDAQDVEDEDSEAWFCRLLAFSDVFFRTAHGLSNPMGTSVLYRACGVTGIIQTTEPPVKLKEIRMLARCTSTLYKTLFPANGWKGVPWPRSSP